VLEEVDLVVLLLVRQVGRVLDQLLGERVGQLLGAARVGAHCGDLEQPDLGPGDGGDLGGQRRRAATEAVGHPLGHLALGGEGGEGGEVLGVVRRRQRVLGRVVRDDLVVPGQERGSDPDERAEHRQREDHPPATADDAEVVDKFHE